MEQWTVAWSGPLAEAAKGLLGPSGVSQPIVVDLTVVRGKRDEARARWCWDGKALSVTETTAGGVEADVMLSIPMTEAGLVLDGTLPPAIAYMRGQLKASGDMELVLRLLAASAATTFARWREAASTASL